MWQLHSTCGEASGYFEWVDVFIERDVIDSVSIPYSDLLLNILIDYNFCMLNVEVEGK